MGYKNEVTYLVVRRMLSLVTLILQSSESKEIEILLLRHKLEVLRRQSQRPAVDFVVSEQMPFLTSGASNWV